MQSDPNQQSPSDTEAGRRLGDALVAAQAKYPSKSLAVILSDVEEGIWDGDLGGFKQGEYPSLYRVPDADLISAVYDYARG